MTNDWTLGLATGLALEPDACTHLRAAIESGDLTAVDELSTTIVPAVETTNSSYFRFELEGVMDADEPVAHRLAVGDSTRRIGLGLVPGHSTRKLIALVVLATSGDGLTFELDGYDKRTDATVGMLIMIPSYCSLSVGGSAHGVVDVAAFHAFGNAFR